jgi:hypothetical protein
MIVLSRRTLQNYVASAVQPFISPLKVGGGRIERKCSELCRNAAFLGHEDPKIAGLQNLSGKEEEDHLVL